MNEEGKIEVEITPPCDLWIYWFSLKLIVLVEKLLLSVLCDKTLRKAFKLGSFIFDELLFIKYRICSGLSKPKFSIIAIKHRAIFSPICLSRNGCTYGIKWNNFQL